MSTCYRCGEEPLDAVDVPVFGPTCLDHLIPEDRRLLDFAADRELAFLEASYRRDLERVLRLRAEIHARRHAELARSSTASSGWGE